MRQRVSAVTFDLRQLREAARLQMHKLASIANSLRAATGKEPSQLAIELAQELKEEVEHLAGVADSGFEATRLLRPVAEKQVEEIPVALLNQEQQLVYHDATADIISMLNEATEQHQCWDSHLQNIRKAIDRVLLPQPERDPSQFTGLPDVVIPDFVPPPTPAPPRQEEKPAPQEMTINVTRTPKTALNEEQFVIDTPKLEDSNMLIIPVPLKESAARTTAQEQQASQPRPSPRHRPAQQATNEDDDTDVLFDLVLRKRAKGNDMGTSGRRRYAKLRSKVTEEEDDDEEETYKPQRFERVTVVDNHNYKRDVADTQQQQADSNQIDRNNRQHEQSQQGAVFNRHHEQSQQAGIFNHRNDSLPDQAHQDDYIHEEGKQGLKQHRASSAPEYDDRRPVVTCGPHVNSAGQPPFAPHHLGQSLAVQPQQQRYPPPHYPYGEAGPSSSHRECDKCKVADEPKFDTKTLVFAVVCSVLGMWAIALSIVCWFIWQRSKYNNTQHATLVTGAYHPNAANATLIPIQSNAATHQVAPPLIPVHSPHPSQSEATNTAPQAQPQFSVLTRHNADQEIKSAPNSALLCPSGVRKFSLPSPMSSADESPVIRPAYGNAFAPSDSDAKISLS
eukprot:GHVT01095808.1.p1 GENE.GHVT01095808.1~~GHVT01095808.1.p1  ORF type:complete len:619 (-),score=120.58 GHVT01095808.1:2522-4378(-)